MPSEETVAETSKEQCPSRRTTHAEKSPVTTLSNGDGPERAVSRGSRARKRFRLVFDAWLQYAWRTAVGLRGLAVTVFAATLVAIAEGLEVLRNISLAVVTVLVLGALIASVFACREAIRNELRREGDGEQDREADADSTALTV